MIKAIPVRRALPGMWFHRIGGSGLHPAFVRHSFLLTAREIDALRRGGVEEILIDTELGLAPRDWGVDGGQVEADPEPVIPVPEPLLDHLHAPSSDAEGDAGIPDSDEPDEQTALAGVQPQTVAVSPAAAPAPEQPVEPASATAGAAPANAGRRSIEVELAAARKLCHSGKELVSGLFHEARMGRAIDPKFVEPLVAEIRESVNRHPDALISVARLKRHDDYTYLHSVAVCALMVALARRLRLPDDAVREAGIGGMLHDIGKAAMPLSVLNKPGGLSDEEYRLMKTHPQAGFDMLKQGGSAGAAALEIALHHHEKFDGSGYPHGQAGEGISLYSRMGAVCDVYDAISSNRPYKNAWSPAESVRRMAAWKGHFDAAVFNAFVRSVGIYPVGALVRLHSEHLAVVLEQHDETLLTPKVRVFFNARKRQPVFVRDLDLAAPRCGDRITGIESPEAWGFTALDQLWLPG